MLVIIDYGMGNVGSIKNMLTRIGVESIITSNESKIKSASGLIFPGVGSFDAAMRNLDDMGIVGLLNKIVMNEKIPVLSICLGMQLMTKKSQEGLLPGLGWVDAEVKKFRFSEEQSELKIPHMGWNYIDVKKSHSLFSNLDNKSRFYFVHSYHVICNNDKDVLTETIHGYSFQSSFQKDNIVGVQFHPEKSHKFGMKLFENFINYYSCG